jgi:hypothetical protein
MLSIHILSGSLGEAMSTRLRRRRGIHRRLEVDNDDDEWGRRVSEVERRRKGVRARAGWAMWLRQAAGPAHA